MNHSRLYGTIMIIHFALPFLSLSLSFRYAKDNTIGKVQPKALFKLNHPPRREEEEKQLTGMQIQSREVKCQGHTSLPLPCRKGN